MELNPERTRLPRGFLQGVSLRLSGVKSGSAVPVIVLSLAASTAHTLFSPDQAPLELSRDTIVSAVAAAQYGKPVTDFVPEKLLGYFQVFGRSLRDDEAIEFSFGNSTARLTKETRRKLLAGIKNVSFTDTAAVVGMIPEADQEKGTFQLQTGGDQRFVSKDFARHRDEVIRAFNGYSAGVKVRVRGVWRFGETGQLQGIDEVTSVDVIDQLDIALRIEELSHLEDGWFDGQGQRLSPTGVIWITSAFDGYYGAKFILPHIYPTISGKIRAEWTLSATDASLEVDLEKRNGVWHELNLKNDDEATKSLDLSRPQDWEWMMGRIEALGGVRND